MNTPAAAASIHVSADVTAREWDEFVRAHPEASAYHQWGWRAVFERAFGHQTEYLVAREGDEVVGVLPLVAFDTWMFGRFAVSLPFVNYGGVLARHEPAKRALLDRATARAAAGGWSYVELRHRSPVFADLRSKRHKVAMQLALPDSKQRAWDNLDRKVRNQIRKAQKAGLTATRGGIELLSCFYDLFARNMRDLGTPVYPKSFFAETLKQFPDSTGIIVINKGSQPIAAGFLSTFRNVIEVPSAGALREFRSLCPNHQLYWTVIEHAIDSGLHTLDFGRSTPGEGTFLFKEQWGACAEPLCWEYQMRPDAEIPDRSPANPRFGAAIAMWKNLPVSMTTVIGPRIVRSIP